MEIVTKLQLIVILIIFILSPMETQKSYKIALPAEIKYNLSEIRLLRDFKNITILEPSALPVSTRASSQYCLPKFLRKENNFNYPGCLIFYLKKAKTED